MHNVKRKIVRLQRDTIVEATFELRFEGTTKTVADLIPGLLFGAYKDRGPKALRTPVAEVPREFQASDPLLKYSPRQGILLDNFRILFGDLTAQVSHSTPYVGWTKFRTMIIDVLDQLKHSGLIKTVERCSLKYVNLIPSAGSIEEQFGCIKLKAVLGERDLTKRLTMIRTEVHENKMINIVELSPNATVRTPDGKEDLSGFMISVDTVNPNVHAFWDKRDQILDSTHEMEKSIYFDTLTDETIASLDPVYE